MLTKVLKFPKLRFIAKVISICWPFFRYKYLHFTVFPIAIFHFCFSAFPSNTYSDHLSYSIYSSGRSLTQDLFFTTLPSLHFYHSYTAHQQIGFIFQSRTLPIPLCAISVSAKTFTSPLYAIYASTASPRSGP
jgi:hypothetical protein